jgi:hypothetical protein
MIGGLKRDILLAVASRISKRGDTGPAGELLQGYNRRFVLEGLHQPLPHVSNMSAYLSLSWQATLNAKLYQCFVQNYNRRLYNLLIL